MRIEFRVICFLSFLLMVMGFGCSKANSHNSSKSNQDIAGWKILYKANCGSDANQNCLGKYGISISSDKVIEAGPDPKGKAFSIQVSDPEIEALNATAVKFQAAYAGSSELSCLSSFETEDSVAIEKNGAPMPLFKTVKAVDAKPCNPQAEELHNAILNLAQKYSIQPFPSDCSDNVIAASSLQAQAASCKVDADCALIADDYTLLDSAENWSVATENCSKLRPLPAANKEFVNTKQGDLQSALSKAQSSCGQNLTIWDCSPQTSKPDQKPVCVKAVCQLSPSNSN